MPYKKQKAIRSNKKDIIYDLMTDLGLFFMNPWASYLMFTFLYF